MSIPVVPPDQSHGLLTRCGAMESGHFLLSSGLHSDRYVQVTRLSDNPRDLEEVAGLLCPHLEDLRASVVVSPALGAILFGHELARALGIRHIFAERPAGQFEFRRGFHITPGEAVLLAENVVTTGGSVLEVARLVTGMGGVVVGYATVIDRSQGKFAPESPVFTLAQVEAPTYTPEDCPLCREGISIQKPGSRRIASTGA